MLEPMQLVEECEQFWADKPLKGLSVLITAGPTRESIDPVRYISNHSSGKMGFALAQAAVQLGASTNLVAGPVSLDTPVGANRIDVASALEMHNTVMQYAPSHDIFISCAAVADYRPESIAEQKIKKKDGNEHMTITMVKNPDIVASVANMTDARPYTVGFAAETQDVAHYARSKLTNKNLDMICANDVSIEGQGFNSNNNNAVTLYWKEGEQSLTLASKQKIAQQILMCIAEKISS